MATTSRFPSLGWAAIDWIEHYLVHGPGDVQGEPIELDDEYAAFIVKAYRLNPKSGAKIVRRAFLSRPKGRAKSELGGMLCCFEGLGPCRFDHWAGAGEVSEWGYEYDEGEPVGAPLKYVEILNIATEENQAGNTYDNVYYMLHPDTCSEELKDDFGRLDVGLSRVILPDQRGTIEPGTAADESKDGGKSTFIVADETHLWIPPATGKFKLGKMHQTMVRNLLKRKIASGWMLETSTMYAAGEGSVAEGTHAYAKSPAGQGGRLLFDHKQSSDGYDFAKISQRMAALKEVYGPAAAWMPLREIAESYDDPQTNPLEWERYWTNRPVPLEEKPPCIIPRWADRATKADPPPPVALGIASDFDQIWLALGTKCAAEGRPAHLGSTLHVRVANGGKAAFVAEVKRIQAERNLPVGIDPKGPASFLMPDLEREGVKVTPIGIDDFVQACADVCDGIEDGSIEHGDYDDLNGAVEAAGWRKVGDRRAFARRSGEISALEAVAVAHITESLAPDPVEPFALWG